MAGVVFIVLFFFFVTCVVTGAVGSWIAAQKNRPGGEGFALGFFFGPLGLIIEALLPTLTKEQLDQLLREKAARRFGGNFPATPSQPPSSAELEARRAREQEWREVRERERGKTREVAEEARRHRAEALAKMRRAIFGFGWFRALPDWLQPILIGLAVALPVVALIAIAFR